MACRTHADVQNAICRALKTEQWVKRSDTWIGKHIGCEHKTVTAQRDRLESGGEIPRLKKLRGEDGKDYTRPKPKPKPKPATMKPNVRDTSSTPDRLLASNLSAPQPSAMNTSSVRTAATPPPPAPVPKGDEAPSDLAQGFLEQLTEAIDGFEAVLAETLTWIRQGHNDLTADDLIESDYLVLERALGDVRDRLVQLEEDLDGAADALLKKMPAKNKARPR